MCAAVVQNVWFTESSLANLTLRQSSTKLLFWFSKPQARHMCTLSEGGRLLFLLSLSLTSNTDRH